jgi:transketolase
MPCTEWFDEQPVQYQESVLPPEITARVSVEAGRAMPWYKYVGTAGRCISLEHFGASADYETLYEEFGITADAVVEAAKAILDGS